MGTNMFGTVLWQHCHAVRFACIVLHINNFMNIPWLHLHGECWRAGHAAIPDVHATTQGMARCSN